MIIEKILEKLSADEIGKKCGVKSTAVHNWRRRGVSWPKREAVYNLAMDLGVIDKPLSFLDPDFTPKSDTTDQLHK